MKFNPPVKSKDPASINEPYNEEEDEDDDSDFDEDDNFEFYGEKSTGPNSQKQNDSVSSEEMFRKFVNKIKIEKYEGVDMLPSGAGNKIISANKKQTANRYIIDDIRILICLLILMIKIDLQTKSKR